MSMETRCVRETWIPPPPSNKIEIWQKFSKSHLLTLPYPQGYVMSVRCEQPLDELTV